MIQDEDTGTYDPILGEYYRGERAGLRAADREYGRGFYDGFLAAIFASTMGAGIVVIVAWWFAR